MGDAFYYWTTILTTLAQIFKMTSIRATLLVLGICISSFVFAQRGVRIAYIDMDFILENVKEYHTANQLLAQNVEEWKKDIELKKMQLKNLEDELNAEKILLTDELVEDRKAELDIFREEIISQQQLYFGPEGAYVQQKNKLLVPIQDKVLGIVQKIAVERKYDFVFDRSSDLVMLYSAKNYDISDLVLKRINVQERIEERKERINNLNNKTEQVKKN